MIGALVSLIVVTLLVAQAAASNSGHPGPPDLRVAVLTNRTCGTFGNSLPVLLTRAGLRPGDIAADVTVCLKVVDADGRQLSLGVGELVDLDVSCTGNEGTVDRNCGGLARGELAASLVQQVGVAPCSATPPPVTPAMERRLPTLRDNALTLMNRLRRGEVACVRLRLLYQVTSPAAAVLSQSDRVTWRYVFSVTS